VADWKKISRGFHARNTRARGHRNSCSVASIGGSI
jgi:hypothetical protein